ncbi:hypothetical protein BDV3_007245 [Batrachochytrium dendrobatidis]|uniref:Uncharacterized protein n=1 Tax=Batrachochytrium dendrobatidis (strain JEL423) TaxID=403673 RepID=A0A177WQU7_BATDL|nr:hypothetical protein O5D80_006145 [Batrachochytrium dendrobatidis]KAK5667352.1 hypothetical protein QVD99_005958 [Batrachochytrium dendrobatidis]OAJ42196.1 hypothetical protein BDEG_25685 [Batrachochytrium dendrobatidis JEL423]
MEVKSEQVLTTSDVDELSVEELSKVVFNAVKSGNSLLLSKICSNKNQPAVQILLTHTDSHGSTALLLSVSGAHLEVSQLLLKLGANANDSNAYGWTPLMLASLNGDLPHVKLLLHHGAQIDATSSFGLTSLTCAVRTASLQVTQLLCESGANVNLTGGMTGLTPLMLAANSGCTEIVIFLLQNGAECNAQSKINGWTALMYAVNNLSQQEPATKKWLSKEEHWKGADVVRTLLDFGADIDIKNWMDQRAGEVAWTNRKECGDVFAKLCKERRTRSGQSPEATDFPQLSPATTKQGWFSRLTSGEFGGTRERVQGLSLDDSKRSATRTIKGNRWTTATNDPGAIEPMCNSPMPTTNASISLRPANSIRRHLSHSSEKFVFSEASDMDAQTLEQSEDTNSFLIPSIPKRPKNLELHRERTKRSTAPAQ